MNMKMENKIEMVDLFNKFRIIEIVNYGQQNGYKLDYIDILEMQSNGLVIDIIEQYKSVSARDLIEFSSTLKTSFKLKDAVEVWIKVILEFIEFSNSKENYIKKQIQNILIELFAFENSNSVNEFLLETAGIKKSKSDYFKILFPNHKKEAIAIITFTNLSLLYNLERTSKNKREDFFWKDIMKQNLKLSKDIK